MGEMIATNEFKRGVKLQIDNDPYEIVDYEHVKPGKGQAFVRVKLKNLKTGNVVEKTYKSGIKLDKADVEERVMQYLYKDNEGFHFMDTSNYDQFSIDENIMGEAANFIQENKDVSVMLYNGTPIGVSLPNFVELKIVETEPGFKGDTAATGSKPATLETGAIVQVPFFLKEGETIKIDTRTGEYVERVNK